MSFGKPPHEPTIPLETFTIKTPDSELSDLKLRLAAARLPTKIYENVQTEENFGVTRKWVSDTTNYWFEAYDWRENEKRLNAYPAFLAKIKNEDGMEFTLHFTALFSTRPDAIPIILSHGWPGCFIEFVPILKLLKEKYHLIVPSLPGFAYSSKPGPTDDFNATKVAFLFNGLMTGLGFEKYAAQGGDIGSAISCELGTNHPACKVVHINFKAIQAPPEGTPERAAMTGPPKPEEVMQKMTVFGYALEHGTRPSTIGMVVGCNPTSLLAWIGEKYLEWSDITPTLDELLTIITLYWLTDTFPSSIYTYRYAFGSRAYQPHSRPEYLAKPLGYTLFPKELIRSPVHWVATTGNLVWSRVHEEPERGGHFAALEQPAKLWADIEEFLGVAWGMEEKVKGEEGRRSQRCNDVADRESTEL